MPVIDGEHLEQLKLYRRPRGQIIFANLVLKADYRFPRRTSIKIEGIENLPATGGAILAMNHTDRFNYWPFQYQMYRHGLPFTATWVKGKYYENAFMTWFLNQTNNIPLPSRGYLLTTSFREHAGRVPSGDEYRYLRDLTNAVDVADRTCSDEISSLLGESPEDFAAEFEARFEALMRKVMALNSRAVHELGLNLLVFPEGTRSVTLKPGHTGLVEVSQFLQLPIIPVGCNGSNHLYPGNSPLSKGGDVVYRVGPPLPVDGPELSPHRIVDDAVPFSRRIKQDHGDKLEAMTKIVMRRIAALLDPEYQSSAEDDGDAGAGSARFV